MSNHSTLEEFVVDYFGTKELAARRLKITRWTLYRWLDQPGNIQLRYYKKLADITDTQIETLIAYGLNHRPSAKRISARRAGSSSSHSHNAAYAAPIS